MTDNTSVIYLFNEGGDEDFHLLSISLLAANTPKFSEFCTDPGRWASKDSRLCL